LFFLFVDLTNILSIVTVFWGAGFRDCESILLLTSPFEKGGLRGILQNNNPLILSALFL